jgi:general secretion pathway protein L
MFSELKDLFATWIVAVTAAIERAVIRIVPQRRILLVEGEPDNFTGRATSSGKDTSLSQVSFRLSNGRPEPPFNHEWQTALRGSRIEIVMRSDRVLFRSIDFPKAAADFLDGMVRAQIDRLTPWSAADAVFGITEPEPITGERIALTLAATSQQRIQPLLKLAANIGATSIAGLVEADNPGCATGPIRVFVQKVGSAVGARTDVPILLRRALLGAVIMAAASLAVTTYLASELEAEQRELSRQITQRRAALATNRTGGSAETLLARRKQTSPSSVMVFEAMSRALPDSTYVTELRIEGDKLQFVGLTQDAPSLIKLIEQSPQFSRAVFFAPTTRGQNEPGERIHIEAHITPYFGSGS